MALTQRRRSAKVSCPPKAKRQPAADSVEETRQRQKREGCGELGPLPEVAQRAPSLPQGKGHVRVHHAHSSAARMAVGSWLVL